VGSNPTSSAMNNLNGFDPGKKFVIE